jgi:hypothetical protein
MIFSNYRPSQHLTQVKDLTQVKVEFLVEMFAKTMSVLLEKRELIMIFVDGPPAFASGQIIIDWFRVTTVTDASHRYCAAAQNVTIYT